MTQDIHQEIHGSGNIQAGRDVKIFHIHRTSAAKAIRVIDGYLVLFYLALVACLIGTTLPHATLNILTALGAAGSFFLIVLLHLERRRIAAATGRRFHSLQVAAGALAIASILSGCASPLFFNSPDLVDFCSRVQGDACKVGTVSRIAVFGLGLGGVTADAAIREGGIEKPLAAQEVRGYGLISLARVTVYGG